MILYHATSLYRIVAFCKKNLERSCNIIREATKTRIAYDQLQSPNNVLNFVNPNKRPFFSIINNKTFNIKVFFSNRHWFSHYKSCHLQKEQKEKLLFTSGTCNVNFEFCAFFNMISFLLSYQFIKCR